MAREVLNQLTIILDGTKYGMILSPTAYISPEAFAERMAEVVENTIVNHYYKLEDK